MFRKWTCDKSMRRYSVKKGKNLLAIVLCVAMCYIPMQAAGYYKTKNVQYGGINLYYNGVYQNVASKAVVIDGTTYLPVRAFGNMLGLSMNWDQNTQTVSITGTTDTVISAQAEIKAKDYQIAALTKELNELKNAGVVAGTTSSNSSSTNYDTTYGTDILGSELTDTRKALENDFSDYFSDIDFDFAFSLSSSKLRLTVEIDNSSDYNAFNKLSRSEVVDFMEDICDAIRDRHDNIPIVGTIKYTNSNKTLYSFNYSKSDDLSYSRNSYNSSYNSYFDEDDLLDIIEDTTYLKVGNDRKRVEIDDVDVSISDSLERVTFTLYLEVDDDDIEEVWNDYTGTNNDTSLRSQLKSIAQELHDETDYDDIQCILKDTDGHKIGSYDYENNELVLKSI